jgi:ATP-dependent Clp protease, protease subunit
MTKYYFPPFLSFSTSIVAFALISVSAADARPKKFDNCFSRAQAPDSSTQHHDADQQDFNGQVSEWLLNERTIVISKKIDDELAETIIPQLLYLDRKASGKDIYLYINSPGGDITSGMAIYDAMRSLKSDVVTVSVGQSSSMASILLADGTKGKRFALPNSRIMIHQPLLIGFYGGQATEVEIEAKEILYQRKQINSLLFGFTGQPLKRIEIDTERDFYMSAQEAKAYSIVDQVVNQLPSASRP